MQEHPLLSEPESANALRPRVSAPPPVPAGGCTEPADGLPLPGVPTRAPEARLSEAARACLLRTARTTAVACMERIALPSGDAGPPVFRKCGGVFVSLYNGARLRGCVGAVRAIAELREAVRLITPPAVADPRFAEDAVTAAELVDVAIEISILSRPQAAIDPLALIPGVHGIMVRKGDRSGCFLPKVAVERRWTPVQFLSACCTLKAGLAASDWQDPAAEVRLFTVESFREPSPGVGS